MQTDRGFITITIREVIQQSFLTENACQTLGNMIRHQVISGSGAVAGRKRALGLGRQFESPDLLRLYRVILRYKVELSIPRICAALDFCQSVCLSTQ